MTSNRTTENTRTGWTLLLASLGSFMAALDVVIVATAMPTMRVKLDASLSEMEWTINAYNLVFAVLLLTGAALGDRFGRRRMYSIGLVAFAVTSASAALSTTAAELITARAAQGVAGAVLMPLTLTLISDAFPAEKRGAAIGVWGGVTGLGVAAGPVLGGVMRESRGPRPQLDFPGLFLAGAAMFALTWAPVRAPGAGWASAEVIGALVAGVALAGVFVLWERRAAYPMLPLAYFRNRGFTTANVVNFFLMVSLIGTLFFLTQLFQTGLGYSPMQAGARILVWMATPMVVSPLAGALADKIGNKPFLLGGMLLQAGGGAWLAAVATTDVSYGTLIAPLIVSGVGISMCFPAVANAVTGSVPPEDAGIAAGVNVTLRELGGVFGVAILGAVFAAHGGYSTPATFVHGFRPAMWVAAAVPLGGALAAAFAPGKARGTAAGIGRPAPELVAQTS
ncbi:MAG: MFS transporter [Catenulispora sp. 13_1_20CM_3_70_7]|nr:MAG: MFS transporter [Catenulispora sp. 13_1_20CM_3_70_7]